LGIILLAASGPPLIEQVIKVLWGALALPVSSSAWPVRIAWLCAMLAGVGFVVGCLLIRYPFARQPPATNITKGPYLLPWLVVVVPLATYYLLPLIRFASRLPRLIAMAITPEQRAQLGSFLLDGHEQVWSGIGFGADGLGMLLGTLLVLLMPLSEEILFRGYLMNALGRYLSPLAAVFVAAGTFAVLHLFRTTSLEQLFLLFVAAMGYGFLRLWTGNWIAAWSAHVCVNLAVMAPKWFVAICKHWIVPRLMN
jgi:membrane protease YdiL (CAAX protease family)